MISEVPRAEVTTPPTSEPITLLEAKSHVGLAADDRAHDADLTLRIAAAREKFEHDASWIGIARTFSLLLPELQEIEFAERPVTAISSIKYWAVDETQQTLDPTVYQLDTARNALRLGYKQTWPQTVSRWDAVTITYTAGAALDANAIPDAAKQCMLLLIGYSFGGNRGDDDRQYDEQAYERHLKQFLRATYP